MRASVDGKVEWVPLSGLKRFVADWLLLCSRLFDFLPSTVSVTIQRKTVLGIWETLAHHQVSTAASRSISEYIDHALGVDLVISGRVTGAVQNDGTGNDHSEQRSHKNFESLDINSANRNTFAIVDSTDPLEIASSIMTPLPFNAGIGAGSTYAMAISAVITGAAQHTATPSKTTEVMKSVEAKIAEAEEVLGVSNEGKMFGAVTAGIDQYNRIGPLQDDFLTAFPTAISAVQGLLKLGGLIAEVHPIARVIIGVLKGAWTIIQARAQIDGHMHTLLNSIKELCLLTKQYATSKEHDALVCSIVKDISFALMSGATLISGYAEHQKHKSLLQLPMFFTSFEQDADQIAQTLTSLTTKLTGASVSSVFSQVHQISSVLHVVGAGVEQLVKNEILSTLPYAVDAAVTLHDGNEHGCLPGTRTAILEALQGWAVGAPASVTLNPVSNPPTEHILDLAGTKILWLQGVAGSGKSSIAVSVAKFLELTGGCMAYYHFETAKQGQLNPSNLFTTIALQLAAQDAALEAKLVELVNSATPLERKSQDPEEQLSLFLLPLLQQNPKAYNYVTIIIDAFDESGGMVERRKILSSLAGLAAQLPPAVHILITARPESDIQEILEVSINHQTMAQLAMNDLPSHSTKEDICQYVKHMLGWPGLNIKQEHITLLSEKAQLSFQWASTACRYIVDKGDGNQAVRPSKRLKNILSGSGNPDSHFRLYQLYTTVLDAQFGHSKPEDLQLLKLLLGVLVTARKPLSLDTILQLLHTHFSQYGEVEDINEDAAANKILMDGCFAVMGHGLKFNICNLSTSFLPNSSVPGLAALVQDKIGEALSYACHFWTAHLALAPSHSIDVLGAVNSLLSTTQFLYWLEVMSLTRVSPLETLALIPPLQGIGMIPNVTEAMRFTSYYSIPIAQSAPHIYLSAVPFIPTASPLHSLSKLLVKTVSLSSGNMAMWPALRHILQHTRAICCLAVSKYSVVAAGLEDGTILLWNCQTGEQYGQPLTGHTDSVVSMEFSPDGLVLASGSVDHTIRVWDVETQLVKGEPFIGHTDAVSSLAFSPDGAVLASASKDATIRLWSIHLQVANGDPLTGHNSAIYCVAFSPDGATLASGSSDNNIRLWDAGTCTAKGKPLTGHSGPVHSVAFSPNGTLLASGSDDQAIRLWDIPPQTAHGEPLIGHNHSVCSVGFSPDGATLASGSADHTIRLWDIKTCSSKGEPLTGHSDWVNSVMFSHDGAVLVSGSSDMTIRLWDIGAKAAKGELPKGHTDIVHSVAFSPDGTTLASASNDETIRLWDVGKQVAKGQPLMGHKGGVRSVAFSPNGTLLASGSDDETIRLWDVNTQSAHAEPLTGHSDTVYSVAFSPNGEMLASGSADNTIRLWDVKTCMAKGKPLSGHGGWVRSVAFSPNGTLLASGSSDGTLRLWDVDAGLVKGEPLAGHTEIVHSVAFSPDGRLLVSGSADHSIRLWEVETHTTKGELAVGHNDVVYFVAFSPDGKVIASSSFDCIIRLWDAETHMAKGEPLQGQNRWMYSLVFSPDGSLLASGTENSSICIWDTTDHSLEFIIPAPAIQSSWPPLGPTWHQYLDNGWIKGPNDELILWIPPSYQTQLFDERLVTQLGKDLSPRVRLNFDQLAVGEFWTDCFKT
ncbi:hypothetical protein DL93DRAFT_2230742 [Clavulina sp. PMI_390]|nr:hypothetical protein DL93DRAFT_2230742 [Clavulina sp. PMI_390]